MVAPIIKKEVTNTSFNTFDKFEYYSILYSNFYWCKKINTVNDIDTDLILSDCIYTYLKKKKDKKIEVLSNEIIDKELKLIRLRSFIKIMCRNCLTNYFRKKNGKRKPIVLNQCQLSDKEKNYNLYENLTNNKDLLDELIENNFKKKLLYIYESLSDKEQEIYDMLSSENTNTGKKYTKKDVLNSLKINSREYSEYIEKLKNLLYKVLGVESSNYKQFIS